MITERNLDLTRRMLTIGAPLRATLQKVGTEMGGALHPWWVIGSAAVALHGVDAGQVADVDVLLATADAERVLPSIGVGVHPGSQHSHFRTSAFSRWDSPPMPVEFMAGFQHRTPRGWVEVEPRTREPVDVDGVIIFIPGRTELRRLLEAFGRPKDLERADRLREQSQATSTG